jgi:hypothetical protein
MEEVREAVHAEDPLVTAHPMADELRAESDRMGEQRLRNLMARFP